MKKSNKSTKVSLLSVKEISSIFIRIDDQIIDLHKCSSDDFLGLNTDFKKYYKQSKVISENAKEIFKQLTEGGSGDLFRQLQDLYKDLKSVQDHFSAQLDLSILKLKEIQSLFDQLFLPIKNLNQDLMTLKFLLANLKLSGSDPTSESSINKEQTILEFNLIINEFKQSGFDTEKSVSNLWKEISKSLINFESIQNRTVVDLDTILNSIHYGIILFAEKHEETNRQIPELTQKTESCSRSIADIITNLQYQDIIRQKIEHIQETQKTILKELNEFEEAENSADSENQTKLYLKIKDIAGLQAAILVKANKEYQLAIEKITQEFLAIGEDMMCISLMCKRLNISQENSQEIHFTEMLTKLQNAAIILSAFIESGKDYISQIGHLALKLREAKDGFSKININSDKLNSATLGIFDPFSSNKIENTRLTEILQQVDAINKDIQVFEKTIQVFFQKVLENERELSGEIVHFNQALSQQKFFTQTAESMNAILNQLKSKSDRISLLLNENTDISKDISQGVKDSIKQIRYYDLFEKTIVEIINELNEIYQRLKGEVVEDRDKEENLKSVKKLYTMASEHQIHEKIIQSDGEVDLFGEAEAPNESDKKKNSDEVELF